jgi:hypothetical protein
VPDSLKGDKALFKNRIFKNAHLAALAAFATAFLFALTGPAAAQASMGDLVCNLVSESMPFADAFQWVAYAAGVVCTLQCIHHLRGHTESPQNFPLNRGLMLGLGAIALLSLPAVLGTIIQTLYMTQGSGGSVTCASGAVGGGTGLDGMMAGFVGNIKGPLITLTSVVAILCGLFMIIHGLMKASKYGFDQHRVRRFADHGWR